MQTVLRNLCGNSWLRICGRKEEKLMVAGVIVNSCTIYVLHLHNDCIKKIIESFKPLRPSKFHIFWKNFYSLLTNRTDKKNSWVPCFLPKTKYSLKYRIQQIYHLNNCHSLKSLNFLSLWFVKIFDFGLSFMFDDLFLSFFNSL